MPARPPPEGPHPIYPLIRPMPAGQRRTESPRRIHRRPGEGPAEENIESYGEADGERQDGFNDHAIQGRHALCCKIGCPAGDDRALFAQGCVHRQDAR